MLSEHCVVDVVGQRESGEFITGPERCYATFLEAMTDVGLDVEGLSVVTPASVAAAVSSTIGVHYDGLNMSGSSITVSGVDCLGGYVNLSTAWRNRVSSTSNGCPRIRHFNGVNLTGISQDTTGFGGNLSTLNNLADSIQYLT